MKNCWSLLHALVMLTLSATLAWADAVPPSAAELRLAAEDRAELVTLLRRWLDAYPESASGWGIADLSMVVAQVVGLDEGHHPNAGRAADGFARQALAAEPFHLARVAEGLSLAARVHLQSGSNVAALDLLNTGVEHCGGGLRTEAEATYCAFLLRDRSIAHMRFSRYGEALGDLERASLWLEPFPKSMAWVPVLFSGADLACWLGDAQDCLARYRRATLIAEAQNGVDSETAAYGYLGLGWAAAMSGDWGPARASFERAERVWAVRLGPHHPRLAAALIEYGDLLRQVGDVASAIDVFERAVALREARLGPEAFDLPKALDGLGLALLDRGDTAAAARVLERSSSIRQRHLGAGHVDHAVSLRALSRVARAQGDPESARRLLSAALDLWRRTLGPDHPVVAEGTLDLAELSLGQRGSGSARSLAPAIAALRSAYGADHPSLARAWWIEAQVRMAAGGDGVASALRAEAIGRRHVHQIAAGLSERELLAYAESRPRGADLALEALFSKPGASRSAIQEVWQAVARSRGLVFEALADQRRERRDSPPRQDLDRARQALARLLVLGHGDDQMAYSRRLAAARERVEGAERSLSRGLESTPEKPLDLQAILDRLPGDETLIAYRIGSTSSGKRLVAWVASGRGHQPTVHDLGQWDEIDRDLEAWRRAFLRAPEEEYRAVAANLRRRIWDPLVASLSDARRVFVVPDGRLFLLSFATLPSPTGYLIEDGPSIHLLSSERDLEAGDDESLGSGHVLVVGDPAFGTPDKSPLMYRRVPTDFVPLPQARAEGRAVVEAWRHWMPEREVVWAEGEAATETVWREKSHGAIALHVATHGFLLGSRSVPDRGLDRVAARGVGGLTAAGSAVTASLAGFALAGANQSSAGDGRHDGVVTLDEIRQLDLGSARLVVLSFCDSGLGEARTGEGIFGLTRAFRGAGARSMVLAMAPIADRGAKRFMDVFYPAVLGEGISIDLAVRRASLAMLAERRSAGLDTHPFHWGAFVSLGSPSGLF